jgi:uncharacterized protein
MTESFEIDSQHNKISGLMVIPRGNGRFPCVVLSHGLVSSKESSKYVTLSEVFAEAGIASCRFDYHGCGESGGILEETTLTIRLDNPDAVVDYVLADSRIDTDRLGLLGSSFGGAASVVKAARDERIKCISFWATPHTIEKEPDGKLSDIFFRDTLYTDFLTYDIVAEAVNVCCAQGIHGEKDEVVPFQEGKAIYKNIKRPKKFELIKNGDHIFSNSAHRDKVINLGLNWFRRFFLGK